MHNGLLHVSKRAEMQCSDVNPGAVQKAEPHARVMEFWKRHAARTQHAQRTFARANLLRTCYGETGVMDFCLYAAPLPTGITTLSHYTQKPETSLVDLYIPEYTYTHC